MLGAIVALALVAGPAPRHWRVGSGAVASITEAVRRSRAGDTIEVTAGTYREPTLAIDHRLVLLGTGWPVLDGEGQRQLMTLTGDSIEVRGFVLRNSGTSILDDPAAIKANGASHCLIAGNRIENAFFGVYLAATNGCRVIGNWIAGRAKSEALGGNGIHLWKSTDATVEENDVSGHRDGIYLEFTTGSHIARNRSSGNLRYGLHFMFSHDCEYRDNLFRANGSGVAVMYSHGVVMVGNRFERSWGAAAYGLLLKELSDSRMTGNLFLHNSTALYLEGTNRLELAGNRFEDNGWAVILLGDADRNRFSGNIFTGNSFDVASNSTTTRSSFDHNYWDHYRGYDLNRDGVGDVPFAPVRLFSLVVQRNPPALLLLRSLCVDLLDLAERVLPVLTPANLVDQAPLMRPPA
ncbi:MAG TPA: nitrous oxide reductase family maturation protein NosD [Gemmatimonadales bacterium]|nr:nitrous oxide reductase family maturation protein NosD [Gemmatimonadales bacterium]